MFPIDMHTVTSLKSLLADLNVKAPSKARKADLYKLASDAMDTAHEDANVQNDLFDHNRLIDDIERRNKVVKPVVRTRSYNERMFARLTGYHVQNGHTMDGQRVTSVCEWPLYDDATMIDRLTPAQRRRVAKKTGRQYGKLIKVCA